LADQRDRRILSRKSGNEAIEAFDKNGLWLPVIDDFGYAYWDKSRCNRCFLFGFAFIHPVPIMELAVINTFLCAIIPLSYSGRLPAVNMPQHSFTTFLIDRHVSFMQRKSAAADWAICCCSGGYVAVGRKNFLFAESHDAAQLSAMF
jgi:hypothetical protein